MSKWLLPAGFILVGVICLYPYLIGEDKSSTYKLVAGIACLVFGFGSIIYEAVRKN